MQEWSELLIQADCLNAMRRLEHKLQGMIKMIYIDPPFFSGSNYALKEKTHGSDLNAPILTETETYSDKWKGGLSEYLEFLERRIHPMKKLLRSDGLLWLHLDFHVAHYAKVLLDEIFGYENFLNQIIWKRTNSPKAQSSCFGNQHDLILLYAKNAEIATLKPIYRELDKKAFQPYSYEDERGRFRLIEIEAHGIQRTANRKQFEWRGRTAPYLYRKETLEQWWRENRIYKSRNGRYSKKQYLDEIEGLPVSDLWLDIPPVQGKSKEYTGFVTQKPEALLERIMTCSSDEGDLIADFFAGSGTTAVVASRMNRQWLACDRQDVAIEVITKRLNAATGKQYDTSVLKIQ